MPILMGAACNLQFLFGLNALFNLFRNVVEIIRFNRMIVP
jgi:hypothetical protein